MKRSVKAKVQEMRSLLEPRPAKNVITMRIPTEDMNDLEDIARAMKVSKSQAVLALIRNTMQGGD